MRQELRISTGIDRRFHKRLSTLIMPSSSINTYQGLSSPIIAYN
ncbi:MAG: hypothetical protein ACFN1B_06985 [Prevotella denticola]